MDYQKLKYYNKIENSIFQIKTQIYSKINDENIEIILYYYSGIKKQNLLKIFKISEIFFMRIIKNLKYIFSSHFLKSKIIFLNKLINYSLNFDERFIFNIKESSWKWLSLIFYKKYTFYKNSLYCNHQFKYEIDKMINSNIFNNNSKFCLDLISKLKFKSKYLLKIYSIDKLFFIKKNEFIKYFVKKYSKINVESDLKAFAPILTTSLLPRNLLTILERKDFLLKISSKEFIFYKKSFNNWSNLIFKKIKFLVEKKQIKKFENIKQKIKKDQTIEKIFDIFPNQALYYFIKRNFINDFKFDTGRMMVIYPKKQKILRLKEVLEKKFPMGYGLIDKSYIKSQGFSKFFKLNSDLVWSDIYLSKANQTIIFNDFEKFFANNKLLNYKKDIYDNSSSITKFYMDHILIFSRISNEFKDIILIEQVFINMNKEKINDEEKVEIIAFLARKLNHNFSAFLNFLINKKDSLNSIVKKAYQIVEHYKLKKQFLKHIYSNYKISYDSKQKIKNYLFNE